MMIVLVQIYRFSPEAWLLREMDRQFALRGYKMVLWSNREHGSLGLDFVPLIRGPEDELLINVSSNININSSRHYEWSKFVTELQSRYGKDFPEYDANRCYVASTEIFNCLRPALYLCWCGMNPWFAIPKEVAIQCNIPVLTWEAGMLPQTLLLDQNGVCADSQYVNRPIPWQDTSSLKIAKKYISKWRLDLLEDKKLESSPSQDVQDLKVLVLGSMDSANGVIRPPECGSNTLPGYKDGIDLAIKISETGSWKTIYRPHPNEPSLPLTRFRPTTVDVDSSDNLVYSILNADVVVGYGSKSDFVAMAVGKPFVMAGVGLINGKGCAYEAIHSSELAFAINTALQNGRNEKQNKNFVSLVSWMLTEMHYNRASDGSCKKGISELVSEALIFARTTETCGSFDGLLSSKGEDWLRNESLNYQLYDACYLPKNSCIELASRISKLPKSFTAILDFDHTLFLGNSTETFIRSVYPRLYGEIIDNLVCQFYRAFGRKYLNELDRWRVVIALFMAPWTIWIWYMKANTTITNTWNVFLEGEILKRHGSQLLIVSYGFRQLIDPLIQARLKQNPQLKKPILICSDLLNPSTSLRRIGKVSMLNSVYPNINWDKSFVVSDSEEDRELLLKCRNGFLIQWDDLSPKSRPGYFPFRFTEFGKYNGRNYLKKYIIQQDLVVWLFVYATSPNLLIPSILLFLSLYIIYEVGYYENDYIAVKLELQPTLYFDPEVFEFYSINHSSWVYSLLLCSLAFYMLQGVFDIILIGKWVLMLLTLRLVFYMYNAKEVKNRLQLYIILQWFKNFSGSLFLSFNPAGLALAVGQAFQHSITYLIYRCNGNKELFPKNSIRTLIFVLVCILLLAAGVSINVYSFILIFAWCVFRSIVDEHGRNTPYVFKNIFVSAPIKIFKSCIFRILSLCSQAFEKKA